MPNGISLAIVGVSKRGSILEGATTADVAIKYDRAGIFEFSNITLSRIATGRSIFSYASGALDASFINMEISNIHIADPFDTVGNILEVRGCDINIANIEGVTYEGFGNFAGDGTTVSNLNFHTYNGGADVCVFSDNGSGLGGFASTKVKFFNGVHVERTLANTSGGGAIIEVQSLTANREIHMNDIVLLDRDQGGSANPSCLFLNGGGTGVFILKGSIIHAANNVAGQGGVKASSASDVVLLMGTYDIDGTIVEQEGAATFTQVY